MNFKTTKILSLIMPTKVPEEVVEPLLMFREKTVLIDQVEAVEKEMATEAKIIKKLEVVEINKGLAIVVVTREIEVVMRIIVMSM